MSNVIPLQQSEQWLFSVDVVRRTDGGLEARLTDARTSLIESDPTAPDAKLELIANMLDEAIGAMRANARALKGKDWT